MAEDTLIVDPRPVTLSAFAKALRHYEGAEWRLVNVPHGSSFAAHEAASDEYDAAYDEIIATPATTLVELVSKAKVIWSEPSTMPKGETVSAFLSNLSALVASPAQGGASATSFAAAP